VTWDDFPGLMAAHIRHAFARAFYHQAGKGKFSIATCMKNIF
jgi:hypothetical protein